MCVCVCVCVCVCLYFEIMYVLYSLRSTKNHVLSAQHVILLLQMCHVVSELYSVWSWLALVEGRNVKRGNAASKAYKHSVIK